MPDGSPVSSQLEALRTGFADPPAEARPMMRWWWFGPDVTEAEVDRELQVMAAAGIGGVEVAYVYPLSQDSPELLSPPFLTRLRHAAERAHALGLRFDLTLGSGWSFGGPHIGPEHAARKLEWERRELTGEAAELPIRTWPGDRLIAAFLGGGSAQEPPVDCVRLDITDDRLTIPSGSGPRQLLLAYERPTGQVVKRAAAGADGPVLDHYSAAATRAHLDAVGEPLLSAVPAELIGSVFCDSLEVYAANWTPDLITAFEQRRGYPLLPRLYELIIATDGSDRFRADYYRTLTELYQENFVAVVQRWAAGHGVRFRIQGYGVPPATISSYRFADLYEGEGWGWTTLTQTRWATSAAHLYRKPVVSAESWTWLHSPSFRAVPLDLKGEAHELILDGVNQFVGHGWPYSPSGEDRDGLGWFFYAAGAFDDRNPWWPAMPGLMRYLQRLSWLQRQGTPVADVLLYLPADDLYPRLGSEVGGSLDLWREAHRTIDPAIIAAIREHGWNYDLIDDDALADLDDTAVGDRPDRPVIILPAVDRLPDRSRTALERHRAAGGRVIAVGGSSGVGDPVTVGGLPAEIGRTTPPDLTITVLPGGPGAEDLAGAAGLDGHAGDLGTVHRRVGDLDVYLVINTGPFHRRAVATPRSIRERYELWDPDTARVISAGTGAEVPIALDPYQACVLVCSDAVDPAAATPPPPAPGPVSTDGRDAAESIIVADGWTVQFPDDVPIGVRLPHRWEDDRTGFSGTAVYRTTATLHGSWCTDDVTVIMELGGFRPDVAAGDASERGIRGRSYRVRGTAPVREVVEVIINGHNLGVVWAPPYRIDLTGALVAGDNAIELRVSNTAANALAEDTAIERAVEASRRQYGQRFVMQDLDRAMDTVASGLLDVPRLLRFDRCDARLGEPANHGCGSSCSR